MKTPLKNWLAALSFGAAICAAAPSAWAITIGFDDLAGPLAPIANGYDGFNWTNMWTLNATNYPNTNSGYHHGVVSPKRVAFNGFGGPAAFSATNQSNNFSLTALFLTAAWNKNLNVKIDAFDNGILKNTQTVVLSTLAPTAFFLNWTGIDKVLFTSFGGTNAGLGGGGTHFALDDLVLNESPDVSPVPVPPSLALFGTGLCGLVTLGRRRNRAS